MFERFSEVLSETLSEADFPLRGSQPLSCWPLNFLQPFLGDFCSGGFPGPVRGKNNSQPLRHKKLTYLLTYLHTHTLLSFSVQKSQEGCSDLFLPAPRTRRWDKVQGSVGPRFTVRLAFLLCPKSCQNKHCTIPEELSWYVLRNFLQELWKDPRNSHSLLRLAKPFSPYSIQKHPEPQICPKLSQRLFSWVPVRGSQIWKKCQSLSEIYSFSNFDTFFQIFEAPDWNPQKQTLGQILDKFGVRGVFECCKGKMFRKPKKAFWSEFHLPKI